MEAATPTYKDLQIYHVKSYSTISPVQLSLSTEGKTIVVAGLSNEHVGRAIAESFAESGAKNLALLGQSESVLKSCTKEIKERYPAVNVTYFVTDAKSTESVGLTAHHIRSSLGAWDVFVQAATHSLAATTLVGADTDDFWESFEQNVRSIQHFAKHFIPKKRPNATYISLVSRISRQPVTDVAGFSALAASQSAVMKLNHFLAAEHPDMRVYSVDPGRDHTKSRQDSVAGGEDRHLVKIDEMPKLCGDFCVWLTAPEQDFLRGRFLRCNWDASELVAMKAAISADVSLLN
jgi:NAD(P)-dependent dehydrogenase (short-subunit alcohol dehydrogenase family)